MANETSTGGSGFQRLNSGAADPEYLFVSLLERLEREEEQAHRRLQAALAGGNPLSIDAAQSFWLKCSETLRRLDLAVEVARREAETQVPLRVAQDAVTATAEWLRISVTQFLSAETVMHSRLVRQPSKP